MSVYYEKQIERGVLATMQLLTLTQRTDLLVTEAEHYHINKITDDIDGYSFTLDPLHPANAPGRQYVRVY